MSRPLAPAAPTVPAAPAVVRFHGRLDQPLELTVAQLRARRTHRVEVSYDCLREGEQNHSFEGPKLWDVVREAQPQVDLRGRKQRLRHLLTVTGADGHFAVLSWAEIDPDFGGQQILLATSVDGAPLDSTGPQLVVPADHCGARYISAVTEIWVGAAGR
ncbi:molybdopterin-dependent oxidoreductase [Kitasatospora sp. NPDC089913]|uniref:molybdopterin-dependent oxidoreductase n=1 Tax=Streptomycetaceae TaxID=2062 RepID=UPI00087AFDCF|nr:molybdopterin-dependent oxidoreductase [Streptomyces sp. TLI_053]SDS82966.1 Oxidoreductase molybdopterin binding domain-containing protein [Streptomyces sp. TLI_053]